MRLVVALFLVGLGVLPATADARRARHTGYAVPTAIAIGGPAASAPAPAPVAAAPPAPSPVDPVVTPPADPSPAVVHPKAVQVRAREFSLTLSTATVAAGPVRVEYSLQSAEDPHDLVMTSGASTHLFAEQQPGTVVARSIGLAAGAWRLYCSLPGHADLGMDVTLQVK